jgi:hypothetical protein
MVDRFGCPTPRCASAPVQSRSVSVSIFLERAISLGGRVGGQRDSLPGLAGLNRVSQESADRLGIDFDNTPIVVTDVDGVRHWFEIRSMLVGTGHAMSASEVKNRDAEQWKGSTRETMTTRSSSRSSKDSAGGLATLSSASTLPATISTPSFDLESLLEDVTDRLLLRSRCLWRPTRDRRLDDHHRHVPGHPDRESSLDRSITTGSGSPRD